MKSYVYITNTDFSRRLGGWDGLGGKVYDLLKLKLTNVTLIDKVNPTLNVYPKWIYKFQKLLKLKRIFPLFNENRLIKIKKLLDEAVSTDATYLIFHGSTPWINYKPKVKYSIIIDCSFESYLKTYHNINHFNPNDFNRIKRKEIEFLKNAHTVFFTSHWAIKKTTKEYNLNGKNFIYMGQGPTMLLNSNNNKQVSVKNQFIFIASDFKGKGGEIIVKAFSLFQKNNLAYSLLIVGQKPPPKFINLPNVTYLGYIDKSSPKGLENLSQLFQESKSMVLLTRKDILPLTIIEGGLLGCPTIANPLNAIPEAIEHLETGWLIESNINKLIATFKYISGMNSNQYNLIRQSVIKKMELEYNWDSIITKIITRLNN